MSNQMNPWLASIYGTDGADDLEKTAQAHLLHKLAAESNLDISQLSPEEMQQLVQELAAEGYDVGALMQGAQSQQAAPQMGGMPQQMPGQQAFAPAAQPQMPQGMNPSMMQGGQAPQQDMASMQKEAQAKFEEADLLGRVMAHAYTDELEKIASHRKTAAAYGDSEKDEHKRIARGAGRLGGALGAASGAHAGHSMARAAGKGRFGRGAAGVGGAALGAAVGYGSGYAEKRLTNRAYRAVGGEGKKKTASAFEKLAEEHAAEILSATGYDPSTGQDTYGQQMLQDSIQQGQPQQQAPQQPQFQQPQAAGFQGEPQGEPVGGEQFTEALDQRALELLAENGYDVNEILARIQMAQNQPAQGQA